MSIGLTTLVYVGIGWFGSRMRYQDSWSLVPIALFYPFGVLIMGAVLASPRSTGRTGAGILIGLGIGLLVSGGLCQYLTSVGIIVNH